MDLNSIRDALRRAPFRKFDLCLADGRRVSVQHPEFVAMTQRIVVVAAEDSSVAILEPLLIVSLEYETGAKGGNGSQKKQRKP